MTACYMHSFRNAGCEGISHVHAYNACASAPHTHALHMPTKFGDCLTGSCRNIMWYTLPACNLHVHILIRSAEGSVLSFTLQAACTMITTDMFHTQVTKHSYVHL